MIYGPGIQAGDAGAVSALQIAPTLAALLGVAPPPAAREASVLAGP